MTIMAKQPIIWRSKQYKAGEIIPCADEDMIKKWLESGAVVDTAKPQPKGKAAATTAPGAPGKPVDGTGAEGEMPGRPKEGKAKANLGKEK